MNFKLIKQILFLSGIFFFCFASNAGIKDVKTFFNGFVKDPKTVGAVLPCTSRVGEELVRYIRLQQRINPSASLRILEVGAGTGSMTEVIVKYLRTGDHLDLVEISPEYSKVLDDKFSCLKNVSIYNQSILDFKPAHQYDIIISTLPFMSLDFALIEGVIVRFKELILSGGFVSFVGYAGIPELKRSVLWGQKKREHAKKLNLLNEFKDHYQIDKRTILGNFPPINIYHLCITK